MSSRRGEEWKPVEDARLSTGMSIKELMEVYYRIGGFTSKDLVGAVDILCEFMPMEGCVRFLSFTGNLVATGLRGMIADLLRRGYFDIVITTGGTVDHDIARGFGGKYFQGSFDMDDVALERKGLHRLGNVLIPIDSYGPMIERSMLPILERMAKQKDEWSAREVLQYVGRHMDDSDSILKAAAERGVPIYCPGIMDSAFGTNLFIFSQSTPLRLDLLQDAKELSDLVFPARRSGALILGGGISKHHTIWWNQFKGGLDYAVYMTTAMEFDGSLSGARVREAISWGKVKPTAKHVTLYGELSVTLPLVLAAVYERQENQRSLVSSS